MAFSFSVRLICCGMVSRAVNKRGASTTTYHSFGLTSERKLREGKNLSVAFSGFEG